MPRKVPKKKVAKAKLVNAEVMPPANPFADVLKEKVLVGRNHEIKAMQEAEVTELASCITDGIVSIQRGVDDILSSAALTLLNAWTCGSMLNIAKEKLNHGEFQKWVIDQFSKCDLSLRTAQRYMQLAKNCPDARDLVSSKHSLRQAYMACGILPEPPEQETNDDTNQVTKARAGLIKSMVGMQGKLRRFSEQKIRLDQGTRKDLIAAKKELDKLFRKLLK